MAARRRGAAGAGGGARAGAGVCCAYCAAPLARRARVVCAVCAPAWSVSSCVDCFSVGAAWAPHAASHDYVVVEELEEAVFQDGWAAAEELRLLEAVARFGPSNWKEVADAVGGGKGLRACEAHYERVYLGGKDGAALRGVALLPKDEVLEEEAVLERREEEARRREAERGAAAKELVGLVAWEAEGGGGTSDDGAGGVGEGSRRREAALAAARVEADGEEHDNGDDDDSDEDFVPVGLEEEVLGDEEEYYEFEAGDGEAGGERENAECGPGEDELERRRRKKGGAVARRRRNSRLDGRRRRRKVTESDAEAEDAGGGSGAVGRVEYEYFVQAEGARFDDQGMGMEDRGGAAKTAGAMPDAHHVVSDAQRAVVEAKPRLVPGDCASGLNAGTEPKFGIVNIHEEGNESKARKSSRVNGDGEGVTAGGGSSDARATDEKSASNGLPGWFEKRGDFDVEFDDEAEEVLADLVITPEDSEEEQELKMRILEIYNARLDERERAKRVVVSRGMLDFAAVAMADDAVPASEREVTDWLARFERILEPTEAALFREAVLAEHRLAVHRARIEQYRALGCRTFADARQYDLDAFDRMRAMGIFPDEAPPLPVWEPPLPTAIARDPTIGLPAGTIPDFSDENPGSEGVRSILPSLPLLKCEKLPAVNGVDSLSRAEAEVCSALRLLPEDYAILKKAAIEKAAELENHDSGRCENDDVVIVNVVALQSLREDGANGDVNGTDVPAFSASARFGRRDEATVPGFDVRAPSDNAVAAETQNDNEIVPTCQSPTVESASPGIETSSDVPNSGSVEAAEESCADVPAAVDLLASDSLEAHELQGDTALVAEEKGVTEPSLSLFSASSNAAKVLANAAALPPAPEDSGLAPPLSASEPAVVLVDEALDTSSTACQAQSPPACLTAWPDEVLNVEAKSGVAQLSTALEGRGVDTSSAAGPSALHLSTTNEALANGKKDVYITLDSDENPDITSIPRRTDASTRPRRSRSSTRRTPNAALLEDGSIIDAKRKKRGRGVVACADRTLKRQRVRDPPIEVVSGGSFRTRVASGVGSSPKLSKCKITPASSLRKSSSPAIESSKASPAISTRSLRSNDSVTRSGRLRQ